MGSISIAVLGSTARRRRILSHTQVCGPAGARAASEAAEAAYRAEEQRRYDLVCRVESEAARLAQYRQQAAETPGQIVEFKEHLYQEILRPGHTGSDGERHIKLTISLAFLERRAELLPRAIAEIESGLAAARAELEAIR